MYRLTRFEEAEKGNPKQRENERTLNKKWTQKKGENPKPFPFLCYYSWPFALTLRMLTPFSFLCFMSFLSKYTANLILQPQLIFVW